MHPETKNCQNCKSDFTIASEDFAFYEKMGVPAPTFCFTCRLKRRMAWRGERYLHRRKCAATGKDVITCFSEKSGVPVVDKDYWWSDDFDPLEYGRDYDFAKPFFMQFKELMQTVPSIPLFNAKVVDSPYTNYAGQLKNTYLSFGMWDCEDVMYSSKTVNAKNSLDLYWSMDCELCYDLVNCKKCYGSKYLVDCTSITASSFLFDCHGSTDCFMSANLRNQSYVFRGQQLTKDEYQKQLAGINLGSFTEIEKLMEEFKNMKQNAIHKYAHIVNATNSTGDYLSSVSNCTSCFDVDNAENCHYCVSAAAGMKDTYDTYGAGAKAEQMYEVVDSGDNGSRIMFSTSCWADFDVYYSIFCHNADNLFGCIGVHKKQYCILNKQYSKEEYEEMVKKIKQHMMDMPYVDDRGVVYRFGEFFPAPLSPFGYNQSIGQEYFTMANPSDAAREGLPWEEIEKVPHQPTISYDQVPDAIQDVDETCLGHIFPCTDADKEYSNKVFKIMPDEFLFYKKMNIPLPRKSHNARHYDRMTMRTPLQLFKRITQDGVEVMTPYAPDRPEKIYSEKGYQDLIL
jgi:hypothetical protein